MGAFTAPGAARSLLNSDALFGACGPTSTVLPAKIFEVRYFDDMAANTDDDRSTEKAVNIDGYHITVRTREITGCNLLRVSAGTNCPRGGDAGHGGRTVIMFDPAGNTEMEGPLREGMVKLVFKGDSECETLIDGLELMARTLREMLANNCRVRGLPGR